MSTRDSKATRRAKPRRRSPAQSVGAAARGEQKDRAPAAPPSAANAGNTPSSALTALLSSRKWRRWSSAAVQSVPHKKEKNQKRKKKETTPSADLLSSRYVLCSGPPYLTPVPLIQGEKPLTLHSPPPALTNPVFFFKNPKKGKKKQEKQQKKRVSFLVSAGLMIDASSVGMFELYCKVQKQTYFLL